MLTYIHIVFISVSKIVLNNPILAGKFTTVINKVIILAAVNAILYITCYEYVVVQGVGRLLFFKPALTKSKAKLAPTEVTMITVHSLLSCRAGLAAINS